MSPRTGRPPKDNPRNINLNIRVTKDEAKLIQDCADALGTTRTEVIIEGVKRVKAAIEKQSVGGLANLTNTLSPDKDALSEIYYNRNKAPCQTTI